MALTARVEPTVGVFKQSNQTPFKTSVENGAQVVITCKFVGRYQPERAFQADILETASSISSDEG